MASKRHHGESSSSKRAFNKKRFVSAEAAEKFDSFLAGKTLTPERGLRPDALVDGEMARQIRERGWGTFTDQPDPVVIAIVKEFYANAMDTPQSAVMIRGKRVSFSRQTINEYYNVTGHDDPQYAQFASRKPVDYETIVAELCKPETVWTTRGQRGSMTFPSSCLSLYGKIWHAFLCAKLMPSTHTSNVTTERAILLYAIVKDWTVDVGTVIEASIKKHLKGLPQGGLPHPSLICGLCWRAGVRWGANELLQAPMAVLDHALIDRYQVWKGGESHPRGLGFNVQPNVPPHANDPAPSVPMPEGSSARAFGKYFRRLQRLLDEQHKEVVQQNQCLAQRQEIMHTYNYNCNTALEDMFARMNPGAAPFHFPPPPPLPVYPPPTHEEVDDSSEEDDNAD